jgi:signal transduction histidine kinase/CheY-like chemotaxis protein
VNPERRLAIQHTVTSILADAPELGAAAARILEAICRTEGWSIGLLWEVDRAGDVLRLRGLWSAPDLQAEELIALSRTLPVPRGIGLPGRAWSKGQPVWIDDVAADAALPCGPAAGRARLQAGGAFPVRDGGGIIGILEFFARGRGLPDASLLECLEDIGRQLGEAILLRRVRRELDRTEERLGAVLSHAPIVLFAFDRAHRITVSEGRALEALGLQPGQTIGMTVDELYGDVPGILDNIGRALAGEAFTAVNELPGPTFLETRFYPRRDAGGTVVEVIGVSTDITDRVLVERRMAESDRLAAVGTLAGGLAHEINNPLTYALLNLSRIAQEIDSSQTRLVEMLAEARAGVERVAGVVQDLAALTRGDPERRVPVDVVKLLESVVGTTSHTIKQRARLVTSFEPIPRVSGSEARLGQVFLSLVANAVAAIPDSAPAENEIKLRTLTDPDGRAVVIIADSGPGLGGEAVRRIFEPFFGGAGLGLSISHAIVTSLGGTIAVESAAGRGTSFVVTLPAAKASLGTAASARGGLPRVLVIDDEPVLAQAIADALAGEYEVEAVTAASTALARLDAGTDYDLILCDLIMPIMNGMALYATVAAKWPGLAERMVFMTGGAVTAVAQAFVAARRDRILDKPFDLALLQSVVRSRLQEHS